METPGYSEREDAEVSEQTGGGATSEDEPVESPEPPDDAGSEGEAPE